MEPTARKPWLIIAIVIIVVIILGVIFVVARSGDSDTNTDTSTSQSSSSPAAVSPTAQADTLTLSNFGLAKIAPYTASTGRSGDVLVTKDALREYDSQGLKGFYVFGDTLSGNRKNPNFEFSSVAPDASIVAATDGVIAFVREQPDTKDFEVFLQPRNNSMWTIGYDHLSSVTVKQGDTVKAGDPLGKATVQGNGQYRFELQINKDVNGATTHVCPSTLLAANVKDTLLADLTALQNAWETVAGKTTLYDQATQTPIGCLSETLTPAQAEGR